jgi:hypothetical protein
MSKDVELGNIELKKKEEPQVDKSKVKTDVSKTEKKIGIVMVAMFLFLILLVVFVVRLNQGGIERVYFEYKGIDFTPSKTGVGFDMKFFVGDAQYPTLMTVRNDPRELENISINGDGIREVFSDKSIIYITEDPFDNLTGRTLVAANELAMPFSLLFQMEVNKTVTRTSEELDIPLEEQTVKVCSDSDENTQVILLRLGAETAVFEEDGCIVVQGGNNDEMEIIRAADRLYLTLLGIMS